MSLAEREDMTIDEAIEYELSGGVIPPTKYMQTYREQIAEWLKELKERREADFNYVCLMDKRYTDGYNKAIDDVMKKAREIQEEQIKNLEQSPMRYGKRWAIYMGTYLGHMQVACKRLIEERLKS